MVVYNKVSFSRKDYKDGKKAKPLRVLLPNACRRDFDETKYMFYLTKDDQLLEKHNKI